MAKSKLTYEMALAELEDIRSALESNDIPIDQLPEKVKKAHELLKLCKEKLRATEDELNNLAE